MGFKRYFGSLLLATVALPVWGQLYVCTTQSGKTVSADLPPRECAGQPIRELRPDGSIRRVIEPPLTDEQKAKRAQEELARLAAEKAAREQLRKDLALLEAYGSEDEIELSRDRQLAQRNRMVQAAQARIDKQLEHRKKLDNEKEFYLNREIPDKLKRAYETNDTILRSEEKIIEDLKADITRINAQFDEDRRRFRELVASGAVASRRARSENASSQ